MSKGFQKEKNTVAPFGTADLEYRLAPMQIYLLKLKFKLTLKVEAKIHTYINIILFNALVST